MRQLSETGNAEPRNITLFDAKRRAINGLRRISVLTLSWIAVALLATISARANQTGVQPLAGIKAGQVPGGSPLPATLRAPAATVHVDACAPGPGDGSASDPFNALPPAVTAAPLDSSVVVQPGSYAEPLVINKALTIAADGGPALVGAYYVGSREVCVPVTVTHPWSMFNSELPEGTCSAGGPIVNARVYYPARGPGSHDVACGGPFPVVVYAHGRRGSDWNLCDWSVPLVGEVHEDYQQAEGILTRLAASGIIGVSVDVSWGGVPEAKGSIMVNTIAYLRDENDTRGSWLEGAVDLTRVGLSGHSTGGGSATWVLQNLYEPVFDQLNLSAVAVQGLGLIGPTCPDFLGTLPCLDDRPPDAPLLVIHGTNEHPQQVGESPLRVYTEANSPKHLVVVTGANHFGYTDGICLDPADSPDNASEVGGVTGQAAHFRQGRTARDYVHAFFSHYLQGDAGALDYLSQTGGQQCGNPGNPPTCGLPLSSFNDLEALNVDVSICTCSN
jgi:hypothetical protein